MSRPEGAQVVWFKRDLRVYDHTPLARAAERGPVVALYVHEPEHLGSEEFETSHFDFVDRCLEELDAELRQRGIGLTVRVGEMPEVLSRLERELSAVGGVAAVWSHQETGLRWSFDRDTRVGGWCRDRGIPWHEISQNGVIRRLRTRDGWASRWTHAMRRAPTPAPVRIDGPSIDGLTAEQRPTTVDLGLPPSTKPEAQIGGRTVAVDTLRSFLRERGVNYRADMSSPLAGWEGCSRLSTHLAWGTIGLREVYHATMRRVTALRGNSSADPRWRESLKSFESRLRWHCHFIQKLEDEPAIEFENMNRGYDGMREEEFDEERFAAWREARTGYPMVDACMRCVQATGWLNFRMRAMLVSFASHHLWLHWRRPAVFLARHFLDFEPGIHFSQFQMQSGTTGINAPRIYSPAKQQQDQDPTGEFVRRWLPELEGVPDSLLAEPHRMSASEQQTAGVTIGRDYPQPIVDHLSAYRAAHSRLHGVKRSLPARENAQRVFQKHGSRRSPKTRTRRSRRSF